MSTWMNDAVPNHNGNGFPHMNDPNASAAGAMMDPSAFMANSGQFNPAQLQQQQQPQQPPQQVMQNGPMRNVSPSTIQNPAFQTNPVIPSKRPRPRDDGIAASPTQNPGMLPTSRSQTPQQQQQNFPGGFQPGAIPQQGAGQFGHLQANGSANASPSPIMGNQMRPGSVPQRVATASPHPFSPGNPQFAAAQASPAQSEQGTPQPSQFMPNMPQGYNPNFAASPSNPRPSPIPNPVAGGPQMMPQQMQQMPQQMGHMASMYPHLQQQQQQAQQQQQLHQQQQQSPQQSHQQHMGMPGHQQQTQQRQQTPQGITDQHKMAAYQMRLQQQLQGNMQMQAQMKSQNMGRGMIAKQQMQAMPNGQVPPQAQPGMMRPRPMASSSPEQFMKNLATLMAAKGLPLDTNPMIMDRPVNLMMLFQAVQNKGGYKAVVTGNGWLHVAQVLGLPVQIPNVAMLLKQIYERNLYKFEEAWMAQQKQRMMQQQQQQQQQQLHQQHQHQQHQQQQPQHHPQQQPQHPQQPQPPQPQQQFPPQPQQHIPQPQGTPQKQMTPNPLMNQGQMQQQPPQQPSQQTPHMPPMPQQTPVKPPQVVNGFPTPQKPLPGQTTPGPGHNRNSGSRGAETPVQGDFSMASPAHAKVAGLPVVPPEGQVTPGTAVDLQMHRMAALPDEYTPCARELVTFGGVDLNAVVPLGTELLRWAPDVTPLPELGNIDIHALNKSIQSGIKGEVRVALDTLATVSNSPHPSHFIRLPYCDDLIDSLIDCAEEQLDILAEHTVEVSDEIQLTSYEDVVRACRIEQWAIKEPPAFGTNEYELDRAVDRLICITTILRNLSFPGDANENHPVLVDETVIKFLCVVVRYLGTRNMLLRTHANTLDFMKDMVIFLSNVSGVMELPGREQALCLLYFLLAFAPAPGPLRLDDGTWDFPRYEPSQQPYLPHAVDALAKLFARDEPNRTMYRTIFALDASSAVPEELLTRAFALSIAPLPDTVFEQNRPAQWPPLVEMRKPFLMQGLLSAEILAFLAPGPESDLAKSWLISQNCLGETLIKLISRLSQEYDKPQPLPPPPTHGRGSRAAPPAARKDPELLYIVMTAVSLLKRLAEKSRGSSPLDVAFLPNSQKLMELTSLSSPEWAKEGLFQHITSCFNLGR